MRQQELHQAILPRGKNDVIKRSCPRNLEQQTIRKTEEKNNCKNTNIREQSLQISNQKLDPKEAEPQFWYIALSYCL